MRNAASPGAVQVRRTPSGAALALNAAGVASGVSTLMTTGFDHAEARPFAFTTRAATMISCPTNPSTGTGTCMGPGWEGAATSILFADAAQRLISKAPV